MAVERKSIFIKYCNNSIRFVFIIFKGDENICVTNLNMQPAGVGGCLVVRLVAAD